MIKLKPNKIPIVKQGCRREGLNSVNNYKNKKKWRNRRKINIWMGLVHHPKSNKSTGNYNPHPNYN